MINTTEQLSNSELAISYNKFIKEQNANYIKDLIIESDLSSLQTSLVMEFIEAIKALNNGTASFNKNYQFARHFEA